jgi:hypothetical protein
VADWQSYGREGGLYRRLRDACAADWAAYTWHPFVQQLATGALPLPAFRHYLVQDYLFLIHFARAKALAVVKGESLEAMRGKAGAVLAGEGGGQLRASVRAPRGFRVDGALSACADLLERFGGHPAAGAARSGQRNVRVAQQRLQRRTTALLYGQRVFLGIGLRRRPNTARQAAQLQPITKTLHPPTTRYRLRATAPTTVWMPLTIFTSDCQSEFSRANCRPC